MAIGASDGFVRAALNWEFCFGMRRRVGCGTIGMAGQTKVVLRTIPSIARAGGVIRIDIALQVTGGVDAIGVGTSAVAPKRRLVTIGACNVGVSRVSSDVKVRFRMTDRWLHAVSEWQLSHCSSFWLWLGTMPLARL